MNTSLNSSNIILIGFMGCGKSTISKELYKSTKLFVFDSDLVIENAENLSIAKIFKQKGEAYFRKLEKNFCHFVSHNIRNAIISTGGGMPVFCDVKKMGKVFFIQVDFETIYSRLSKTGIKKRPLFHNTKQAKSLFDSRQQAYMQAAHFIINGNQPSYQVSKTILGLLK